MNAPRKDERFELRLSAEDKQMLTKAAKSRGMKPSEFAARILRRASKRAIEKVRVLKFSRRDQLAMLAALTDPPEPSEKLKRAWKHHAKVIGAH